MKRGLNDSNEEEVEPARIKQRRNPVGPPARGEEEMEAETDTEEDVLTTFNCPVRNRFAILPVDKVIDTIYKGPPKVSNRNPPKIFIKANSTEVKKLLKGFNYYSLENVRDGTNIVLDNNKQHDILVKFLENRKTIQFRTRPCTENAMKRFVVYGLNSTDEEFIIPDLHKYGIPIIKIRPIVVKRPRYHDHVNFVVYINRSEQITLPIIQKVTYINHTKVQWANYIVNGDGTYNCSRCQGYDHPADFCNLDPVCKVCAGAHLTTNCELILQKRADNKEKIATHFLKCYHCGDHHTAGYRYCPSRLDHNERKAKFQRRRPIIHYTDAPLPERYPWTNAKIPPAPTPVTAPATPLRTTQPHRQHPLQPRESPSNLQVPQDKFSAKEIAAIFAHIINCVDKCKTKSEQLQTIINVVAEYYIP